MRWAVPDDEPQDEGHSGIDELHTECETGERHGRSEARYARGAGEVREVLQGRRIALVLSDWRDGAAQRSRAERIQAEQREWRPQPLDAVRPCRCEAPDARSVSHQRRRFPEASAA